MDNDTGKENTEKTLNRSSYESKQIRQIQARKPVMIDVSTIDKIDFRIVNNYPEGQVFSVRQADNKIYDCKIINNRIVKSKDEYEDI